MSCDDYFRAQPDVAAAGIEQQDEALSSSLGLGVKADDFVALGMPIATTIDGSYDNAPRPPLVAPPSFTSPDTATSEPKPSPQAPTSPSHPPLPHLIVFRHPDEPDVVSTHRSSSHPHLLAAADNGRHRTNIVSIRSKRWRSDKGPPAHVFYLLAGKRS